jgi:RNA polymerase sigma factor (sigma-70 family)
VLFDRHGDFVYNFAFRRTGSWSAAEEIVEVVLFELWQQRRRVVTKHESLRPWLAGVALNHTRHWWRSAERQSRAFGRLAAMDRVEDDADEVASRVDDTVRVQALLAALERLPASQRDVMTLFAWEELNYAEIGEALGLPVGTVRSRLSRARARLRATDVAQTPDRPPDRMPIPARPAGAVPAAPALRNEGPPL